MEAFVQFLCVSTNETSVLQQNNNSIHFTFIFSIDTDGDREDSDTTSHNSAQFHRDREGMYVLIFLRLNILVFGFSYVGSIIH